MRTFLLSPFVLLLCGCEFGSTWLHREDYATAVEVRVAEFAVTGMGVTDVAWDGAASAPGLVVAARQAGGTFVPELVTEVPPQAWFTLRATEAGSTEAVERLLRERALGTADRGELAFEWRSGPQTPPHWRGKVAFGGELAPGLPREVVIDESTARALLDDPRALLPDAEAAPGLAACVALAERADWVLFCPAVPDGRGKVLACLAGATGDPADCELIVEVSSRPPHAYVRVPGALVPAVAAVRRDVSTLIPRFQHVSEWRPQLVAQLEGPVTALPLPRDMRLSVRSIVERATPFRVILVDVLDAAQETVECVLEVLFRDLIRALQGLPPAPPRSCRQR